MAKYRIVFKYKDKIEYYQGKSFKKPWNLKDVADILSMDEADKVVDYYSKNPFGNWEQIILEVV